MKYQMPKKPGTSRVPTSVATQMATCGASQIVRQRPLGLPSPLIHVLIDQQVVGPLAAQLKLLAEKVDRLEEGARRGHVFLSYIDSPDFDIARPIGVEIALEPSGGVTAFAYELLEYAEGPTEEIALAALGEALLESLHFLAARENELGPGPARQLRGLRYFLRERP